MRPSRSFVLLFVILLALKTLLVLTVFADSAFSDNYTFVKMARSVYHDGTFTVHGLPTHYYSFLYPIILSWTYVFGDMTLVYLFMKLTNVFVSTLAIVPVWLLARDFLKPRTALLLAALVGVLPSTFAFAGYLMAENLFYHLFLFTIYFYYKAYTTPKRTWAVLGGLFAGLAILTKALGLTLLILPFLMLLRQRTLISLRSTLLIALFALPAPLFILLRNLTLFGATSQGILGGYAKSFIAPSWPSLFFPFLYWIAVYLLYFLLSGYPFTGLTFHSLSLTGKKFRTLLFLSLFAILAVIFVSANHNIVHSAPWFLDGRPIGRHVDTVLPLLFLLSTIAFTRGARLRHLWSLHLSLSLLSSGLLIYQFFPVNNLSLSWIGTLKTGIHFLLTRTVLFAAPLYLLTFLLFGLILFALCLFLLRLRKINHILLFLICLSFSVSILGYAINASNAYTYWYMGDQAQLGLWLNQHLPPHQTLLIDSGVEAKLPKESQDGPSFHSSTLLRTP